ncbi:MAG: metalloregulator ArsR/SmtB family transcription factor [Firmicutes bacterium]|nr:metalloregulator ArsR/SmtB family transcription factor [Bacillota bacterium]
MVKRVHRVERCDCVLIHETMVNQVMTKMPMDSTLYDLAELYKVFGDSTRIRILWALVESEMCVCDIAYVLNMTQSATSHQLKVLKQAIIVKSRREGKIVYYSIDDEHVKRILKQGLIHNNERITDINHKDWEV